MILFSLLLSALSLALAMDIVVPAYFYPAGTYWSDMATAASQVGATAILNPNSGPGTASDPNYVTATTNLRNAGGRVLGYVSSRYGDRPLTEVKADIDAYLSFYTIDGFFIDEMHNIANSTILQYYKDVYNYVKSKNCSYTVMGNPGTLIPEDFVIQKVADRFVTFENSQTAYGSYSQPSWQDNYPASTFVHMVYAANATQMKEDIPFAKSKNIGGMFVTDDQLPNPYDTLPPYWNDEVAAVVAANGS